MFKPSPKPGKFCSSYTQNCACCALFKSVVSEGASPGAQKNGGQGDPLFRSSSCFYGSLPRRTNLSSILPFSVSSLVLYKRPPGTAQLQQVMIPTIKFMCGKHLSHGFSSREGRRKQKKRGRKEGRDGGETGT